jgi:hypothetical protein
MRTHAHAHANVFGEECVLSIYGDHVLPLLLLLLQMVVACRVLASEPGDDKASVTNVVFMGMGEPLDNLESVMAAVDIMTHPLGLHMSKQKVRPP